jgi:pimeloyl-ACP methyl ester carboxylesterase
MGESGGVSCPSAAPRPSPLSPPERGAFDAYASAQEHFTCDGASALGPLHDALNSWQVTHDMDAIRAAGRAELTYFGNSNGTVYGQAYADLFGANAERMYLDSVADHTTPDLYGMVEPKAVALEANLNGFVEWCAQEPTCALHTGDALAVWDRVVAAAGRVPISAPGSGPDVTVDAAMFLGSAGCRCAGRRGGRAWPLGSPRPIEETPPPSRGRRCRPTPTCRVVS